MVSEGGVPSTTRTSRRMDLLRRWYRGLLDDGNNSFFSKSIIILRASRDQLNDVTRALY